METVDLKRFIDAALRKKRAMNVRRFTYFMAPVFFVFAILCSQLWLNSLPGGEFGKWLCYILLGAAIILMFINASGTDWLENENYFAPKKQETDLGWMEYYAKQKISDLDIHTKWNLEKEQRHVVTPIISAKSQDMSFDIAEVASYKVFNNKLVNRIVASGEKLWLLEFFLKADHSLYIQFNLPEKHVDGIYLNTNSRTNETRLKELEQRLLKSHYMPEGLLPWLSESENFDAHFVGFCTSYKDRTDLDYSMRTALITIAQEVQAPISISLEGSNGMLLIHSTEFLKTNRKLFKLTDELLETHNQKLNQYLNLITLFNQTNNKS